MTDIAALVVFRIWFGSILVWHTWRYFENDWIYEHFIGPQFHFKYYGFSWIDPLPGTGMYGVFLAMGLCAICVTIGFAYRISAMLLGLPFTYIFLIDQAYYLNHYYLVSLVALLLVCMPAHGTWSVDAWLFPKLRRDTVPAWTTWLLRVQIAIVYFYAAIAKLNADWLSGEPMRMWLAERQSYHLLGPLLPVGEYFTSEWVVHGFSLGGLLFDLLVVPLLIWKRTRWFAFAWCVAFHLLNFWLSNIGIFPWFMLGATLLFFGDDWPRKIFNWPRPTSPQPSEPTQPSRWVLAGIGLYLAFQVLFPLRHFIYPDSVHWTEEGHRFAWHMKLRAKAADARFTVIPRDANGDPREEEAIQIELERYLTSRQIQKMSSRPDMILQFAHFLRDEYTGERSPIVRADVTCRLNGHPPSPLIDSQVDLGAQPRNLWPADWIVRQRTVAPRS